MASPARDALDRRLLNIADTDRVREYGTCRVCGASTRDTSPVLLTVGVERGAHGDVRRYRIAQRGRTFCGRCAKDKLAALIDALEAT